MEMTKKDDIRYQELMDRKGKLIEYQRKLQDRRRGSRTHESYMAVTKNIQKIDRDIQELTKAIRELRRKYNIEKDSPTTNSI